MVGSVLVYVGEKPPKTSENPERGGRGSERPGIPIRYEKRSSIRVCTAASTAPFKKKTRKIHMRQVETQGGGEGSVVGCILQYLYRVQ